MNKKDMPKDLDSTTMSLMQVSDILLHAVASLADRMDKIEEKIGGTANPKVIELPNSKPDTVAPSLPNDSYYALPDFENHCSFDEVISNLPPREGMPSSIIRGISISQDRKKYYDDLAIAVCNDGIYYADSPNEFCPVDPTMPIILGNPGNPIGMLIPRDISPKGLDLAITTLSGGFIGDGKDL